MQIHTVVGISAMEDQVGIMSKGMEDQVGIMSKVIKENNSTTGYSTNRRATVTPWSGEEET